MKRLIIPLLIVFIAGALSFWSAHHKQKAGQAPEPRGNILVMFIGQNGDEHGQSEKQFAEDLNSYMEARKQQGWQPVFAVPIGATGKYVFVEGGKIISLNEEAKAAALVSSDPTFYQGDLIHSSAVTSSTDLITTTGTTGVLRFSGSGNSSRTLTLTSK